MTRPTVSVICSVYKSERFLDAFLNSFLGQTVFRETQLVLNFSAPSKAEMKILYKYRKAIPFLVTIKHEKRVGIYQAWNECLEKSTGKYIAIWNVDDSRTPNSLESQLKALDKSEAQSAMGPFVITSSYGEKNGKYCPQIVKDQTDYFKGMYHGPFFMFRKSCLNILKGFDEQFQVSSDFDFCIRLSSLGPVARCSDNLGYYLNERKGISTSKLSVQPIERDAILCRYGALDLIDVSNLPTSLNYNLKNITIKGHLYPLTTTLINYENIRQSNLSEWTYKYFSANEPLRVQISKLKIRISKSLRYRLALGWKSLLLRF
jgi:glycosyltransferase involved in cell wall biosynthesis